MGDVELLEETLAVPRGQRDKAAPVPPAYRLIERLISLIAIELVNVRRDEER